MENNTIQELFTDAREKSRQFNDTAIVSRTAMDDEIRRLQNTALADAVEDLHMKILRDMDKKAIADAASQGSTRATVYSASGISYPSTTYTSPSIPVTAETRDYGYAFLVRGPLRGRHTGTAFWAKMGIVPLISRLRESFKPFHTYVNINQGKLDVVLSWDDRGSNMRIPRNQSAPSPVAAASDDPASLLPDISEVLRVM